MKIPLSTRLEFLTHASNFYPTRGFSVVKESVQSRQREHCILYSMACTRTISLQGWWRASSCRSLFFIKFVWICSSTAAYLKNSLAVGTTSSVSFLGASPRLYRWHLFNSCFLFFFCSFRFRAHDTPITLSYAFTHSIPLSESWKRMENPHFSYEF